MQQPSREADCQCGLCSSSQKFREGLKKGDKVVTIGGIYGTVVDVKEKTLLLEIDNNVRIKVDKNSVVKDFSEAQPQ